MRIRKRPTPRQRQILAAMAAGAKLVSINRRRVFLGSSQITQLTLERLEASGWIQPEPLKDLVRIEYAITAFGHGALAAPETS